MIAMAPDAKIDVKTLIQEGADLTDKALEKLLPSADTVPVSIHGAMRHSVFAGGKRLRPVLAMQAGVAIAGRLPKGIERLGAAIEMIHTYSLIHDDLPALDNDDLRRGKPTCHVAFGEAIAILAGDALQTLAFQTIAQLKAGPASIVDIVREFSLAIGTGVGGALPPGMIGGQVVDIESEGRKPSAELVERIHRAKTGALITTSIVCGGLLGLDHCLSNSATSKLPCTSADVIARLRTFGEKAGLAFQIVDDILDVTQTSEQLGKTAGKDTATDKATWPAVFGIERSRHDANELIQDAFAALEPFGAAAGPLKSLALYLVERTH